MFWEKIIRDCAKFIQYWRSHYFRNIFFLYLLESLYGEFFTASNASLFPNSI